MQVKWARSGEATIVRLLGDSISLLSTVPAPPGARIDGAIFFSAERDEPLRVKVHGSKKQDDGTFMIEGRCIDMTRELRGELEMLIAKTA